MSYFLNPANSIKRMIDEWCKYDQYIVAVDFDSTLKVWHEYEGEHCDEVCDLVKELKKICGCYLILFTANKHPEKCLEWCEAKGIYFDNVNENAPEGMNYFINNEYPEPPRKIYWNSLLDDKAGLSQVYNELKLLVHLVKNNLIKKQHELV